MLSISFNRCIKIIKTLKATQKEYQKLSLILIGMIGKK